MKLHIVLSLLFALTAGSSGSFAQMSIVNGASYGPGQPLAPGSFATVFGQNLCQQTATADWVAPGQLPTSVGGCSVTVNGVAAMMYYASPGQVNFVVPQNLGPGPANVLVNNGQQTLNGSMTIGNAGPGVFAMNGAGVGEGAMLHGTTWQPGPFSVTTDGQSTPVSIFMTGLDLSEKPAVMVGGVPVDVTYSGIAPGYVGLQQINIMLPPSVAGAGRVPVTVTSDGVTSNVTFMNLLPTNGMMEGVPGWGPGMMIRENAPRQREVSYLAFNPANNTALVTDENDDVVRVISLASKSTTATITLPADSRAHAVAVDATGQYAGVVLSAKDSVALIDLTQNKAVAVIGTGTYPSHAAFAGTNLLVTNAASGTVTVIDVNSRTVTRTVNVGFGPSGIAVEGNLAVVANMQDGSLSLINLVDFSVTNVTLPVPARPHEVAISGAANKVIVTNPPTNGVLVLDLGTNTVTPVDLGIWNARGPGAVVTNGNLAFVANQMNASVTVVDLSTEKVVKTFPVDPGPRALAVNQAANQLLVLAEGTGTMDLVDLNSYEITDRINVADTERQGVWTLPLISAITPNTAAAGSTITLTISGANLQAVKDMEFHITGMSGGGMGRGMGAGPGMGNEDPNIQVSNIQVNQAGTQLTATVQISSSASPGVRQIHLETDEGEVMGPMFSSFFTVTQ